MAGCLRVLRWLAIRLIQTRIIIVCVLIVKFALLGLSRQEDSEQYLEGVADEKKPRTLPWLGLVTENIRAGNQ